ncbi:toll/interleukin-1 receptor domain-containing protein [Roseobacteraceae bacterium NS-SX3]
MSKLWLTYAWKDNEDDDVDFVVQELERSGLNVAYDRKELIAGRRLWNQIEQGINDPTTSAWAIFLSRNSLESEPCQEELAYALDRALRTRGSDFPLIGILSEPMDRSLIPSSLATRLYVDLTQNNWREQIVDGVLGAKTSQTPTKVEPFGIKLHPQQPNGNYVVEVWPRTGSWAPFWVVVGEADFESLSVVMSGPRGHVTGTGVVNHGGELTDRRTGKPVGTVINDRVTSQDSGHIFLRSLPKELRFGTQGELFTVSLNG